MTLEAHRKIESTLETIFYNKNCDYENIKLKQVLDELEVYIKFIKSLRSRYGIKKDYSIESIAENIFSPMLKDNYKFHIEAFYVSLLYIQENLKKSHESKGFAGVFIGNNVTIGDNTIIEGNAKTRNDIKISECPDARGILELLNDLIIDFRSIYWIIEKEFYNNVNIEVLGINRAINGLEMLDLAKNVLNIQLPYLRRSYSCISIFLFRQLIEVSILRAFGVYAFFDENIKEAKFSLSNIFDFLRKNKKYIKIPVKISVLEKITQWSNTYIHKAVLQYHWEIIIAYKILLPLYSLSKNEKAVSIYGIQINKQFYDTELEKSLKNALKLENTEPLRFDFGSCFLTDETFE